MLSTYIYDKNFKKVDYDMSMDHPDGQRYFDFAHICFFETEQIYKPQAYSNKFEDVIRPAKKSWNAFDGKKLTKPISEFTIDLDALSDHYHSKVYKVDGEMGQKWAAELENYRTRGTSDLSHATAVTLIGLAMFGTGSTGGSAALLAPLTPPIVAALLGVQAVIENRVGSFVFRAKGNETKLADNIYQTIDPNAVDVKKLSTETSYENLKKSIAGRVTYFRDLGNKKSSRKCEELLPKDSEWRAELLKYSQYRKFNRQSFLIELFKDDALKGFICERQLFLMTQVSDVFDYTEGYLA